MRPSRGFFLSGQHWDRASELSDGATPGELGRTGRVRLHELRLEVGQRIAYVFDYGDEHWYSLEVEALLDSDTPPLEPRILESVGEPLAQYAGDAASATPDVSALVTLANEFSALFPEAEESDVPDTHDNGDDDAALDEDDAALDEDDAEAVGALDLSSEELDSAHTLARQLALGLEGSSERFMALERACDSALLSLLADLPAALAIADKVDDGAEIAALRLPRSTAFSGRARAATG